MQGGWEGLLAGAGKAGKAGKGKRKAGPGVLEASEDAPKGELEENGKRRSGEISNGPASDEEDESNAAKERRPASRNGKTARRGQNIAAKREDEVPMSGGKKPKTKKKSSSNGTKERSAVGQRRSERTRR